MYRKDLFDKAGPQDAGEADLGLRRSTPPRRSPTARTASTAFACAARPAGARTWRSSRDVEFVRRALVRREVEPAVRHAGVEEDAGPTYLDLMKDAGPPGASATASPRTSRCSSPASAPCGSTPRSAGVLRHRPEGAPMVADKVGFALAPTTGLGKHANWLWAWALASPPAPRRSTRRRSSSPGRPSKHYTELVASQKGWANVPPGTRTSLYENPDYQKVAPFAQDDAGLDRRGRSESSDGQAGALHRRAVRRDPRIPGHRHQGRRASSRPRSPAR